MASRKLLGLVLAVAAAGHSTAHSSQAAHDTPAAAADLHGAAPFESASHKPLPLQVFAPNDGKDPWTEKYGGSPDYGFTGIATYAHLPSDKCLENRSATFDVAVLGIPFDGAVTYRPGARFGPDAIRSASRRQRNVRAYSLHHAQNPYALGLKVMDCEDVPASPFDQSVAIDQIEAAYSSLLARPPAYASGDSGVDPARAERFSTASLAIDGLPRPKIMSLGGDHTIVLPILRSLHRVYGPIAVIHFDAHLDTWPPEVSPLGSPTRQSQIQHGSFFWQAATEGLIARNRSAHAGIRTRLDTYADVVHDISIGFQIFTTDDIDDIGPAGIAAAIRQRVGDMPVYLSIDVDILDPGFAPGTGTMESGGWSPRELRRVVRGLEGLNFVGMDVVEVSPAYDHAEITAYAASDLIFEMMHLLVNGKGEYPGHGRKKPPSAESAASAPRHDEL